MSAIIVLCLVFMPHAAWLAGKDVAVMTCFCVHLAVTLYVSQYFCSDCMSFIMYTAVFVMLPTI